MTITRVTDDPGTTPFAVERSTPDAHRWLVWALLVEIPLRTGQDQTSWTLSWGHGAWEILLDAQDETRHHGRPIGSHGDTAYGTQRHHARGAPLDVRDNRDREAWIPRRRSVQASITRNGSRCRLHHDPFRTQLTTTDHSGADHYARRAARTGSAASSSG